MANANDMSSLINKIERRLGLIPLTPNLPSYLGKSAWEKVIMEDTLVTFSRYYYNKISFTVDDTTCNKRVNKDGTYTYYIKDDQLQGLKVLGVMDIDWQEFSKDNASLGVQNGYGFYTPDYTGWGDIDTTYETMIGLQMAADMRSLYARGIYLDFEYPNKIKVSGVADTHIDLRSFVVNLLVEHTSLATISPTKMETFEALAQADVANFLQKNLRYYDGLEGIFVNVDLKLSELESEASKRENIIEEIKNSYVSTSNDNIPYIMTIS